MCSPRLTQISSQLFIRFYWSDNNNINRTWPRESHAVYCASAAVINASASRCNHAPTLIACFRRNSAALGIQSFDFSDLVSAGLLMTRNASDTIATFGRTSRWTGRCGDGGGAAVNACDMVLFVRLRIKSMRTPRVCCRRWPNPLFFEYMDTPFFKCTPAGSMRTQQSSERKDTLKEDQAENF